MPETFERRTGYPRRTKFDARFAENYNPANMRAGSPMPPSLDALRRVGPDQVPYSQSEREWGYGQQAADLSRRNTEWQGADPFTRGRNPYTESQMSRQQMGPSWSAFWDLMSQNENIMPGARGMRGRVDLEGEGPGTGTGFGRWMSQPIDEGGGAIGSPWDVEDLMGDAGMYGGAQHGTRPLAMQGLRALGWMRGR